MIDIPLIFQKWDKAVWRDKAKLRVNPANQRLGADDGFGAHINLWLKVEFKFFVFECIWYAVQNLVIEEQLFMDRMVVKVDAHIIRLRHRVSNCQRGAVTHLLN